MEIKQIIKDIYIAEDGKEFLIKEDCEKYEKFVKETLSRIKYFCVRCLPDLTETGNFTHKIYVAVFSEHYLYRDIVFQWALKKFGTYLGESVMGYGFQPYFNVSEVSKEEYFSTSKPGSEKLFLSPKEIDGFPENINYMKKWGFK